MNVSAVAGLCSIYDVCSTLECDGLTRVLHTVLMHAQIDHDCFLGAVAAHGKEVSPHYWIQLPDGWVVDYRLRMWLWAADDIPHGVFQQQDFPDVTYTGTKVELDVLTPVVFRILTA